jgi:amidase
VAQPASRAAVYGLKASYGATDVSGVQPGAASFDCLGGFAKTPADLADLMGILMKKDFSTSMQSTWDGISVGFVDATLWKFPDGIIEPNPEFREQLVSSPFPSQTTALCCRF